MLVIDEEKALDLLDAAVRARGEHTTTSGMYVKNGVPNCFLGVALHLGGLTVDQLKYIELLPFHVVVRDGYARDFLAITAKATEILYAAQRVQDQGATWGAAYQLAQEVARS